MFEKEDSIDIKSIDLKNIKYRISSDNNIDNLKVSIKKNGLMDACVVRKDTDKYIIISGHKRIRAAKEIDYNKIPAKIVKENKKRKKTDLFCVKLAIIENSFHRELDLIEQARGVCLLNNFMTNDEISEDSLSIFNANLNINIIAKLLKIESMISSNQTIHDLIFTKRLSMNTALKISNYESQTMNAFLNIFKRVKMGQNKQSEIILNFHEISKRDNIPLLNLLNSKDVLDIIENENPDVNLKGNLLRSYLAKKRFPELTKAYENHKKGIKDLKLQPEIKLNPPHNFEGEKYTLSFEFRNKKAFDKNIQKLVSINNSKAFENLIK